ncbi:hypothetical protein HOD75_03680 [archaeon]|jgi:hypothetical protein|nr:hypothetical protein [archaeon]MBT4241971.1 hypothetical protein [archaeon]MBT4418518.1 hypothetical protein [archaeon]
MEETTHILKILKETSKALKEKKNDKIRHLSNKLIHHASINQDPDIVALTVIIYTLSKLVERKDYQERKNWNKFYNNFTSNIDDMIKTLESENIEEFRKEINENRTLINTLTGDLKKYISEVFRRAKINKASRLYEHGISMEKTAKILGVSIWELSEYVGTTRIADVNLAVTMPIKQRIKIAEEIFK